MKTAHVLLLLTLAAHARSHAQGNDGRIESRFSAADTALDTNPNSAFWKAATPVVTEKSNFDKEVPGHHTEIRSRWTASNLYLLLSCTYREMNPHPNPSRKQETNRLWEWDVAEAFIGSDFDNIHHYREFEMSPQAEWVDLDIDNSKKYPAEGWAWNSGFQVASRVDKKRKVWYGVMRIPYRSLDSRVAAAGNQLRVNFYREQGPAPRRVEICWKPTMQRSFHVPEQFGILQLVP